MTLSVCYYDKEYTFFLPDVDLTPFRNVRLIIDILNKPARQSYPFLAQNRTIIWERATQRNLIKRFSGLRSVRMEVHYNSTEDYDYSEYWTRILKHSAKTEQLTQVGFELHHLSMNCCC